MTKPFAVPIRGEYAVSSVGQNRDELLYRGYSIHELLANKCCYEECVYLILRGHLPNSHQLSHYKSKLNSYSIPQELVHFITRNIPDSADGVDVLKMAVSYLGIIRSRDSKHDLLESMDELIALMPLFLIIFNQRFHQNDSTKIIPISNSERYPMAKRFLINYNPNSNESVSNEMVMALNEVMILYLEHGITTSAFTARVVTSAFGGDTDVYSAIEAALCAAKGPLHCGANQRALKMLMEYNRDSLMYKLKNKEIIEGFGHRTYMRKDLRVDPRNKYVKRWAKRLAEMGRNRDLYENAVEIEAIMEREKGLFANIDFYGGLVHYQLGIDPSMLVAMICINLCVGWMANIIEQKQSQNKLIRPLSVYIGPTKKKFVPLRSRL